MEGTGEAATYIVQVFADFVPSANNPLLIRLAERDNVEALIAKALDKFQQDESVAVLPSADVGDYAASVAGGDGLPDFRTAAPFPLNAVVRDLGLEFPYMISLVYLDSAAAGSREQRGAPLAVRGSLPNAAAHQMLTKQEAEVLERQRREVAAAREEKIKEIERKQREKELRHFQHCESYEVLRREQAEKERHEADQKATLARTVAETRSIVEGVQQDRSQHQKQSVLDEHRRKMHDRIEEEKVRAAEIERHKEEKIQQAAEAKRLAREEVLRRREAERTEHIAAAFDELLADLDSKVDKGRLAAETRLEAERQERVAAQRAKQELRKVAVLEEQRAVEKDAERERRAAEAAARRAQEDREAAAHQAALKAQQDENSRYLAWRADRERSLEALETQLEVQYRIQHNSNKLFAEKGAASSSR